MSDPLRRRTAIARLVLIAGIVVVVAVIAARSGPSNTDDLRDIVGGHWWGPVVFVAITAMLAVLAVPGTLSTLAAGVLYGAFYGSILAIVGASIGATIAFLISRRFGRSAVESLLGPRAQPIDARLAESGWRALLVLRLVPLVPFNALNYAAGLSGLTLRAYVIGTVVGITPGTIAFTVAGSSAKDPTSPAFLSAVGAVVALSLLSVVVGRRSTRGARSASMTNLPRR